MQRQRLRLRKAVRKLDRTSRYRCVVLCACMRYGLIGIVSFTESALVRSVGIRFLKLYCEGMVLKGKDGEVIWEMGQSIIVP